MHIDLVPVCLDLASGFKEFSQTKGMRIFNTHAETCLRKWTADLMKFGVEMNSAHESVMTEKAAHEHLPPLVLRPKVTDIAASCDHIVMGQVGCAADDKKLSGKAAHNISLGLLMSFCDAIGSAALALPGIKNISDDEGRSASMPAKAAIVFLHLVCQMCDLASVSSWVHSAFSLPANSQHDFSAEFIFQTVVGLLKVLQARVLLLDSVANPKNAISLNHGGWQLPPPISQVREWQLCTAIFNRRANEHLLYIWVQVLDKKLERCRSLTPSWESCFHDAIMDEQMLLNMAAGKMRTIADAHNSIHDDLQLMNNAGKVLDISPMFGVHPTTSATIAVAKTIMQKAFTASMATLGIASLQKWRVDPIGSGKAKQFMLANNVERHAEVPDACWQAFRDVEAHGSPSLPTPAPSEPRSSAPAVAPAAPSPTEPGAPSASSPSGSATPEQHADRKAASVKTEGPVMKRRRH